MFEYEDLPGLKDGRKDRFHGFISMMVHLLGGHYVGRDLQWLIGGTFSSKDTTPARWTVCFSGDMNELVGKSQTRRWSQAIQQTNQWMVKKGVACRVAEESGGLVRLTDAGDDFAISMLKGLKHQYSDNAAIDRLVSGDKPWPVDLLRTTLLDIDIPISIHDSRIFDLDHTITKNKQLVKASEVVGSNQAIDCVIHVPQAMRSLSLSLPDLSTRLSNVLFKKLGLKTFGDLDGKPLSCVSQIKGAGAQTVEEFEKTFGPYASSQIVAQDDDDLSDQDEQSVPASPPLVPPTNNAEMSDLKENPLRSVIFRDIDTCKLVAGIIRALPERSTCPDLIALSVQDLASKDIKSHRVAHLLEMLHADIRANAESPFPEHVLRKGKINYLCLLPEERKLIYSKYKNKDDVYPELTVQNVMALFVPDLINEPGFGMVLCSALLGLQKRLLQEAQRMNSGAGALQTDTLIFFDDSLRGRRASTIDDILVDATRRFLELDLADGIICTYRWGWCCEQLGLESVGVLPALVHANEGKSVTRQRIEQRQSKAESLMQLCLPFRASQLKEWIESRPVGKLPEALPLLRQCFTQERKFLDYLDMLCGNPNRYLDSKLNPDVNRNEREMIADIFQLHGTPLDKTFLEREVRKRSKNTLEEVRLVLRSAVAQNLLTEKDSHYFINRLTKPEAVACVMATVGHALHYTEIAQLVNKIELCPPICSDRLDNAIGSSEYMKNVKQGCYMHKKFL